MRLKLLPESKPPIRLVPGDGPHVYTDGVERWPSVSALISELWPYRGPPNDGTAAAIGTDVHACMAEIATSRERTMISEPVLGHVNRLATYLKPVGHIYAVERPMVNRTLGIAGTVDLVCRRDGRLVVLDWKTKAHEPDEEAWDRHHLQAAAYATMWCSLTGETPKSTVIVASWPGGSIAHERDIAITMREFYSDRTMAALNRVRGAFQA